MAKASKTTRKELQKKTNGDTAVYVRIKPELFEIFHAGWSAYLEKHDLNPSNYGIGSFIRSQAERQCLRDESAEKRSRK